jgi:hypothetical protein
MRRFWPPADAAQADYERLRAAVLDGTPLADAAAARFARGGLAALIARPVADAVLVAIARGAPRPPWTPHADPRLAALAGGYALVLAAVERSVHQAGEVAQ